MRQILPAGYVGFTQLIEQGARPCRGNAAGAASTLSRGPFDVTAGEDTTRPET